jgi:hypothetical protein
MPPIRVEEKVIFQVSTNLAGKAEPRHLTELHSPSTPEDHRPKVEPVDHISRWQEEFRALQLVTQEVPSNAENSPRNPHFRQPTSMRGWLLGVFVLVVFTAFGAIVTYVWMEGLPARISSGLASVSHLLQSETPRVEHLPPKMPVALEATDPDISP